MCGIFGMALKGSGRRDPVLIGKVVKHLARSAESRGKDSSGLVLYDSLSDAISVFKGNLRITHLLENAEVWGTLREQAAKRPGTGDGSLLVMGHSRLVTNGSQLQSQNNQPVLKDGIIGIHNGIIVNDEVLWRGHPELSRSGQIDTEVLLALVAAGVRNGLPIDQAIAGADKKIEGTYSVALLFEEPRILALASNNGSLYVLTNQRDYLVFASEEPPLRELLSGPLQDEQADFHITQITSGDCLVMSLPEFSMQTGPVQAGQGSDLGGRASRVTDVPGRNPSQELVLDTAQLARTPVASAESEMLEYNLESIRHLRRCTRCVLPETFPFITFDEQGVCNYCRNYKTRNQPKPFHELKALVAPYRSRDGKPDCIVPFSGGRDSTYALHIIKTRLGLNPIAFTYDWGMVTDLARRNVARVCGKLGVENIIVAADIHRKRDNIRRNILAWLRRPTLGMVPLFMAGDKYFYYYTGQVSRKTGIKLNIWGINPLENTDFKVGFLGVPPDFTKKHIYSLSLARLMTLFSATTMELIGNPGYINRSLLDSMGGFVSRSVMPHLNYYHLFDYLLWDEHEVEQVLLSEYNWELACDTETTWRIGDGTAAFYNYIYCTVAGFSEHDTFRSNQVREGQLSRDQALAFVERDNKPRYPTLKWYLKIVGLDYASTIRHINAIPKLY